MEKYNIIVKIEEIKRLTENGEVERAVKAADSIEFDKLRAVSDLSVIAEAYVHGKEYSKAREVYVKIYERARHRRVVMQLVNLSIKLKDIGAAEEYLRDFNELAPEDFYRYIFRYSIDKLRGESYETLIDSLERLKKREYLEKWAYELAKLYHKAGMDQKCVDECSDIILWFGEGQYVERAKVLQAYYYGELDPEWTDLRLGDTRPVPDMNVSSKTPEKEEAALPVIQTEALFEDAPKIVIPSDPLEDMYVESAKEDAEKEQEERKNAENISEEEIAEGETVIEESELVEQNLFELSPEELIARLLAEENAAQDQKVSESGPTWQPASKVEEDKTDSVEEVPIEGAEEPVEEVPIEGAEESVKEVPIEEVEEPVEEVPIEGAEEPVEEVLIEGAEEPVEEVPVVVPEVTLAMKLLREFLQDQDLQYEAIFGASACMSGMESQIAEALMDTVTGEAVDYNYLIVGEIDSDKVELAKNISKYLYKTGCIATPKVALISAEKLNRINLIQKKDSLADCCMIIEGAGALTHESVVGLGQLIHFFSGRIAVILTDVPEALAMFTSQEAEFVSLFKSQIVLKKYSEENIVDVVCGLCAEKDFYISEKAIAQLNVVIAAYLESGEEPAAELAKKIADAAIAKAEERNHKMLMNFAESGKFAVTDMEGILAEDLELPQAE